MTAFMLAATAVGCFEVRDPARRPGYPVAVSIAAVALLIAAVFPIEPSLGFPPGAPQIGTATGPGQVHQLAGPVFIIALAVAAITSRQFLLGIGIDRPWTRWSTAVAGTVVAAFGVCTVLVSLDYAGAKPFAPSGLFERIAIYTGLLWTSLTATAALRHLNQHFADITRSPGVPQDRLPA